MGMEAIHPKAPKKLRQADIPLRVANAFDRDPGTLIDAEAADTAGVEIVTGQLVTTLNCSSRTWSG